MLADSYTIGDSILYELDEDGTRRILHRTPRSRRRGEGREYALVGLRGAHGTAGGQGVLLGTSLFADSGSPGYLDLARPREIEPVAVEGLVHEGAGELEDILHLEGERYAAIYNIVARLLLGHEIRFDEPGRRLRVERVLVGQGELEGGILHGLHFEEASGALALSYCTATDPTQLWVLGPDTSAHTNQRARARPCARAPLRWRGRVLRSTYD